ncbi:MAG: hypothetical protein NWE91_00560 [Candidatus Bathyarchaeota archaeon]|nr:hypothetical protein [Candidatus Bathyarchaeota archaeon]
MVKTKAVHKGIDDQIKDYIKEQPQVKCTLTQMAKEGGLRKGGVSRAWLKKHLKSLEERGIIYSNIVRDPIRNVQYKYYTLKATCPPGDVGLPEFISKSTCLYKQLAVEFYSIFEPVYIPVARKYCDLCEAFCKATVKNLEGGDFGCYDFLMLYCGWVTNKPVIDTSEKEMKIFKRKADAWKQKQILNTPLLLEDLTITLVDWTFSNGPVDSEEGIVMCGDCKGKTTCMKDGLQWLSDLIGDYVEKMPQSDLRRFWECMLQGIPEIKTNLLRSYFKSRFNLKEHNPFTMLAIYESGAMPFLYSKVLPRSFAFLVERIIQPRIKEITNIKSTYAKKLRSLST